MADNFTEESRSVEDFAVGRRQWLFSEDWAMSEFDRLDYKFSTHDYAPVEESRSIDGFDEESR